MTLILGFESGLIRTIVIKKSSALKWIFKQLLSIIIKDIIIKLLIKFSIIILKLNMAALLNNLDTYLILNYLNAQNN